MNTFLMIGEKTMPPSYYWILVGEEWLKCEKDTFDSYVGIKYFGPSAWSYEYGEEEKLAMKIDKSRGRWDDA